MITHKSTNFIPPCPVLEILVPIEGPDSVLTKIFGKTAMDIGINLKFKNYELFASSSRKRRKNL